MTLGSFQDRYEQQEDQQPASSWFSKKKRWCWQDDCPRGRQRQTSVYSGLTTIVLEKQCGFEKAGAILNLLFLSNAVYSARSKCDAKRSFAHFPTFTLRMSGMVWGLRDFSQHPGKSPLSYHILHTGPSHSGLWETILAVPLTQAVTDFLLLRNNQLANMISPLSDSKLGVNVTILNILRDHHNKSSYLFISEI